MPTDPNTPLVVPAVRSGSIEGTGVPLSASRHQQFEKPELVPVRDPESLVTLNRLKTPATARPYPRAALIVLEMRGLSQLKLG